MIILLLMMLCTQIQAQDATSGLLERSQIDEKYKWDLSDLYKSVNNWEEDFNWVEDNLHKYQNFEGKLNTKSSLLLECLKFDDYLDSKLNRLRLFSDMQRDVDMKSEEFQLRWSRYAALESEVNVARSFVQSEIISIPERIIANFLAESDDLKIYEHYLNKLQLTKKHTLSAENEELRAKYSRLIDHPYSIFGKLVYADLPFPTVKDDEGKEILLNRSISWRARSSPNRRFRKRGYEEYYGALMKYKRTLAQNLLNLVEAKMIDADIKNYNTTMEASLDKFNLPVLVYDNLIKTVRNNLQPLHRWMVIKKEILGFDTLYIYDTMVSLFSDTEKEYSWEEARDLIFDSLQPLGDNYVNDIREAYEKRWVDAFPNIGKETGGYSTGPKGPHPYVKMNWGGKGLDFTTLVHEFGHYVHGYKIIKKQPYVYRNYPSFLGEIASTTAENVAWTYMIEKASTPSEKLYLTGQFIDLVVLYFFTSAMNAEFESYLYQTVKEDGALTAETLAEKYKELTITYYGDIITLTEFDPYVWAEWPHFYFGFYIYSYATSFAAAIQISENIRREGEPAVNRFIQFLEAGGSDYPVNVIKKAGVDLTSPESIEYVVIRMNELMDDVEKILRQLKQ
jgi:oligoendopeptidase F